MVLISCLIFLRNVFQLYVMRQFRSNAAGLKYLWFYRIYNRYILKFLTMNRKSLLNFLLLSLLLFIIQTYRGELSSLFIRKIQHYIYPSMRILRKTSVTLLESHPQLSFYYDENCLVNNPYFQANEIDCNFCQKVVNILDFSLLKDELRSIETSNTPFFVNVSSFYRNIQFLKHWILPQNLASLCWDPDVIISIISLCSSICLNDVCSNAACVLVVRETLSLNPEQVMCFYTVIYLKKCFIR